MGQIPSELRHAPDLAATPAALPVEQGRSYWQVVGRAFSARWSNLISVGFIVCLALLAVFVPFIANSHPFTWLVKNDAGIWQRQWPLFSNLDRLDRALLGVFVALVAYGILHRMTKRGALREIRFEARLRWLGRCTLWAACFCAGLFLVPLSEMTAWVVAPLAGMRRSATLALILIFIVVVPAIFYLRSRWRKSAEDRQGGLARLLLLVVPAVLALGVGMVLDPGYHLATRDHEAYATMLASGQAKDAIFAPVPWSYGDQEPLAGNKIFEMPSAAHPLGTDGIGRDVLSRLLWSTRVVMGIGFIAEGVALVLGVLIGGLIGFSSGTVDLIGMRVVEIFEAIPGFILILIFVATYGRDIFMIMVILGLVGWPGIARFVRAEFLRLRKLDYVQAAIASGLPVRRVLFRHMLPNGLTPVIVTVTFGIAGAVMSESGLSFLGVGVEPPTPSWGSMLNEAGNPAETFRWWLAIAPGLLIFLTVFAYNIIGEGARDAIDPRMNKLGE